MVITDLHIDLITDILSRLPAKTLGCLKIVCKSWYNLISNDHFANYHLERSIVTKTNLHYVVTISGMFKRWTQSSHYSADFDSFDNPVKLSHPSENCKNRVYELESCRGLLLMRIGYGQLLLYNPTTQTYNVLPILSEYGLNRAKGDFEYGFGYDSVSRDYKCVRVFQHLFHEEERLVCEVMVYSMKMDCWKRVADVPCFFRPFSWSVGTLLHENLHWVGRNAEVIVAFSLRDETFSCLPLPNFRSEQDDAHYALLVGTIDDCLCLLVHNDRLLNIWLMKEYGVVGSWTRINCNIKTKHYNLERLVSYSADKKRLLVKKSLGVLSFIDLESSMESHDVLFMNWNGGLDAHVYVDNLLMLEFNEFGIDIEGKSMVTGFTMNSFLPIRDSLL